MGGVISYVWKGNLLLTKVWFDHSWQVHPERKQRSCEVVTLGWNSCWANRKGKLESRAPGFTECSRTYSAPFHVLSAYYIPINTHASAHILWVSIVDFTDHLDFFNSFWPLKMQVRDKSTSCVCSFTCHYLGRNSNDLIMLVDTRYKCLELALREYDFVSQNLITSPGRLILAHSCGVDMCGPTSKS